MPSADFHIRAASSADIPAITEVTNVAFTVEWFIDGIRTDEAGVRELMQKGVFLVAEEAGRVIASVYVELRRSRGYFGMLSVDPSQQKRGLGKIMAEAAEDHSRRHGCTAMDITVLSLRPELPPYYRKLGYVETGTEEFHPTRPLKDGAECHCIVMSKAL